MFEIGDRVYINKRVEFVWRGGIPAAIERVTATVVGTGPEIVFVETGGFSFVKVRVDEFVRPFIDYED